MESLHMGPCLSPVVSTTSKFPRTVPKRKRPLHQYGEEAFVSNGTSSRSSHARFGHLHHAAHTAHAAHAAAMAMSTAAAGRFIPRLVGNQSFRGEHQTCNGGRILQG